MDSADVIPHPKLRFVDHNEIYGRHILNRLAQKIKVDAALDIGCGYGSDLECIKKYHPQAQLHGVDFQLQQKNLLANKGIQAIACNVEQDKLPFADESLDFVIANQVLEHTKEIFWINHEIFRTLKPGGYLYLGVPNILSLHNRILGLVGVHPTTCQMHSAHVRPFSKRDTYKFYSQRAGDICQIEDFFGSQFYPFPRNLSRFFATVFPSMAVSIFFLIRKTANYDGQFLRGVQGGYETNFYVGPTAA
jgi:ubiquinone/menaquinone biosynthesis C-methylase UbiE